MTDRIKTPRLELKGFSPGDGEALAELLTNGDIKKTYMLPDFANREDLDRMVRRFFALSQAGDRFVRGIYRSGRLIGFVNDVELETGCIELGYVIHPQEWGKGYATEMLSGVIRALLEQGFHTVKTGAFCENLASIRVMEKCGMRKCPGLETVSYRGEDHACVYYERKA